MTHTWNVEQNIDGGWYWIATVSTSTMALVLVRWLASCGERGRYEENAGYLHNYVYDGEEQP